MTRYRRRSPLRMRAARRVVTNAGSAGKFLAVLDLELGKGAVKGVRYRLLPVYAGLIKPDPAMQALIERVSKPQAARLSEKLAVAGDLFYRRGNFNGTMDQLICDALRHEAGCRAGASRPASAGATRCCPAIPSRWKTCCRRPRSPIRKSTCSEMTGAQIKAIMEDVCDNLFNPDPYRQQGGDMVRVGGMDYACAPAENMGKRISDMTLDNGQQARGRQELQGRRLGLGQPAVRQAGVGRVRGLSARRRRPRS